MKKLVYFICLSIYLLLPAVKVAGQCTVTGPAASTTVCQGSTINLAVTSADGTSFEWFSNTSNSNIGGTTTGILTSTYSPSSATAGTSYYYCVVSGACGSTPSSVAVVTVDATPTGGTLSPASATVCSGTNTTTLTLSGQSGTIEKWEFSTDGGSSWTDIAETSLSHDATDLAATTTYRVVVGNGVCTDVNSSEATISVDTAPSGGTLSPASGTVCSGTNTTTLTVSGQTGTIEKWEFSTDGGSSWTDIAETGLTHDATNLTATTIYRVVVGNGVCTDVNSSETTISVDTAPSGGTLSPAATTVCSGTNTTTLTLSGHSGTIEKWEFSTDGGSSWTDIAETGLTYDATDLTATTSYRVVVGNGVCSDAVSTVAVVTVGTTPVGGTLSPVAANVCSGTNSTPMTLSGHSGSIIRWEYSEDGGTTWSTVPVSSVSHSAVDLTASRKYRVLVRGCTDTYSSEAIITVSTAPSGGSISTALTTVCHGSDITLNLSGNTASVVKWQSSVDNWTTSTDIISAATTLNVTNITASTRYHAVIEGGPCNDVNSADLAITVNPIQTVSVAIVSGKNPSCGPENVTFTPSPTNGGSSPSYQWYKNDIAVFTGTNYTYSPVNNDRIKVVLTSDVACPGGSNPATSNEITQLVTVLPDISDMTYSAVSSAAFDIIPLNGTNGVVPGGTVYTWPEPSVSHISGEAAGTNLSSISATLVNSKSYPIDVTYVVTPKNGICTNPSNLTFNLVVTVNPKPVISAKTALICSGATFNVVPVDQSDTGGDIVPALTTYRWSVPSMPGGVSGAASASGVSAISGTLTNTSGSPKIVTYSVIPTAGSNDGLPFNVAVTIQPAAQVNTPSDLTVCNSSPVAVNFVTVNTGGNTTYSWTNTNPAIGLTTPGTGNISFTSANPSSVSISGTVTVTPSFEGCPANPRNFSITIMPTVTLAGATLESPVFAGKTAKINLTGILPGNSQVQYTIGTDPTIITKTITAGSITTDALTIGRNGKTMRINRIMMTDPPSCYSIFTTDVMLVVFPAPLISGPSLVCTGATGVTYTGPEGMDSYTWTITNGTKVSETGNSVTVNWNAGSPGTVALSCEVGGSSSTATPLTVNFIALPVPVVNGLGTACESTAGIVYSTQAGMRDYAWTVPGGTITSASDGSSIAVTWNTTGPRNVGVTFTNSSGCAAASAGTLNVTVNPLPVITITTDPAISKPRIGSTVKYMTQTGMSGYSWTYTSGGTGGTATADNISITWNASGNQKVWVNYVDGNGCRALTPRLYDIASVNLLPSVSNVQIAPVYPGVGQVLTGSYTYNDNGTGSDNSVRKWFRDGVLVASDVSTYTLTLSDTTHIITFGVLPRSSEGPPYEGVMITSAPTNPIEQMGGLPIADQVCIEGTRKLNSILRGKYRYAYTKSEGVSLYEWVRKDTVAHTEVTAGTALYYEMKSGDIADNIDIVFRVKPVSSNLIPRIGAMAESQPLVKILLEKDTYSLKEPAVSLVANRMGGVFTGKGVTDGVFDPYIAGAGGFYQIDYYRNIVNSKHICAQRAYDSVKVSADVAYFTGFPNPICQGSGQIVITANGMPGGASFPKFTIDAVNGIKSQLSNVATLDLLKLRPNKNYTLKFSYVFGFSPFEISQTFSIDSVSTNIKIVNLDSAYCFVNGKKYVSAEGIYPAGGTGEWLGTVLTDKSPASAYIDPMKGEPGKYYKLSYQYYSPRSCPGKLYEFRVKIDSLPDADFILDPTYNLDGGEVTLVPDQPGGDFIGKGVTGYTFYPDLAGENNHIVRYSIIDKETGCSAIHDDTTTVRKAGGVLSGLPPVICYNDITYPVNVSGLPAGTTGYAFSNIKNSLEATADPRVIKYSVVKAGAGDDKIRFDYVWDGVDYWLEQTVNIDSLIKPEIAELTPDQVICSDKKPFKLTPTIPDGYFYGPVTGGYFDPASGKRQDTVKYVYVNPKTFCKTDTVIPVHVYPSPKVDFEPLDVCITNDNDKTRFINKSAAIDPIKKWNWEFWELGIMHPDSLFESSYLYKSGGLQRIVLKATTVMGCDAIKDTTFNLGRKPVADFTWKSDCFHPGANLQLLDNTASTSVPTGWSWSVGGAEFSDTTFASYPKADTGYVRISYEVRTDYKDCFDVITKDVYIRPTIVLEPDGYFQDFENGSKGWIRSNNAGIWSFGTPDGTTIKTAASGTKAWYTGNAVNGASSIESPCFDFTGARRPVIQLDLFRMFEKDRDGVAIQYKIGDNTDWQYLGTIDDGIEWYNSAVIRGKPGGNQLGWTTTGTPDDKWKEAFHTADELSDSTDVKFRIAYGSDGASTAHDGFAFDDFRIGERSRHVLVEHFTNNNSADASTATTLIDTIANHKRNDVINIQYHTNFPGSDPFFEHTSGDASARILFYGLTKVPYTFIDGGINTNYAMIFDNSMAKIDSNVVTKRSLVSSRFDITLNAEVYGNVLTLSGNIKALENMQNTGNLTLFIAVTEKENAGNYTDVLAKDVFQNVFRKFIPDAGGIVLKKSSWNSGETLAIGERTWLIDKVLNNADINVIAFLQNPTTREVFQAVQIEKAGLIVGTPEIPDAGPEFSIYPNPAHDRVTIAFGEPLRYDSDIFIYNAQGLVTRTYKAGHGLTEFSIDDPGLKGGIYMVKVTTGKTGSTFRKLIIVSD